MSFPGAFSATSHTNALRTWLAERYSPATTNRHLAALRGVLKEAWRLGQMSAESFHRAVDLPAVRGERLPRGRGLSRGELRSLFESCRGGKPADARDAALMAILYAAGLRRSEVVALDIGDYEPESGAIRVRGKGDKERVAYIDNGGPDAMMAWLDLRGDAPGPLFVPISQTGEITIRRITDQAVYGVLRSRAKRAKVADFSPHDLRRSCVSDLLDAGVDISVVQRFVGHAKCDHNRPIRPAGGARQEQSSEITPRALHGNQHANLALDSRGSQNDY